MIRNTQVKITCSVKSFSAMPRAAKKAIISGGKIVRMSLDEDIASRTGRRM